jgi:DNA-binding transcriptional regulator YhcF (GntR family)
MLEIDVSSPEPVYEQIVSQIGLAIRNKLLSPSDKLPPIRQLATDLEINPNTVARAYLILEEAGMIETRGRAGSMITTHAEEAYEAWLIQLTKVQLSLVWTKIRTLSVSSESSKRIWKQALKELRHEE